jgi:hypothetical protein
MTNVQLKRQFDKYNSNPTHSCTLEGEDLKWYVELLEIFYVLEEPENTIDLSQKYFFRAELFERAPSGRAIRSNLFALRDKKDFRFYPSRRNTLTLNIINLN